MPPPNHLIVFTLEDQRFGLPLPAVERVVRMVAVTTVAGTQPGILGVINFQGKVIPVFDLRNLLGLAEREVDLSDQLVIATLVGRTVALAVDLVTGVIELAEGEMTEREGIVGKMDLVDSMIKRPEGIILLYNFERLLPLEGASALASAHESAGLQP